MFLHDAIPFLISISGILSGIYIVLKIRKLRRDFVLVVNFLALGFLNIYVGIIYLLALLGIISTLPSSELSMYMRPANLLLVLMPFFISWRMGL